MLIPNSNLLLSTRLLIYKTFCTYDVIMWERSNMFFLSATVCLGGCGVSLDSDWGWGARRASLSPLCSPASSSHPLSPRAASNRPWRIRLRIWIILREEKIQALFEVTKSDYFSQGFCSFAVLWKVATNM